ncbi:YcgJ family protein [Providencia rettgeri]|uniref:YcgJ family protein n=1 Tax=Providencia rettgeri TaxID=587 RepID=UPI00141940DD|nr:YcgJ family protein [Providencia rettgeri]NIH07180.1 hypothetical protein [Providencia rettgeri]
MKIKRYLTITLLCIPVFALAKLTVKGLTTPSPGVLCDSYLCASGHEGVSKTLTAKFLGQKTAEELFSDPQFNPAQFTFSNGIYCDINEKVCRKDRYYGPDGKPSGQISAQYTAILFGE